MDKSKISVKVLNFSQEAINGKAVVLYNIEIDCLDQTWSVKHRYSKFLELHNSLKRHVGHLPKFPGKSLMALKTPEKIEPRRIGLHNYISCIAERSDVYSDSKFLEFLEFKNHGLDLKVQNLECLGRVVHPLMGFRDAYMLTQHRMFFSVTSETNPLYRADSYIMNLNPFSSSKDPNKKNVLGVGMVESWVQTKTSQGGNSYKRLWIHKFGEQAICLGFSLQHRILFVGLDYGKIVFFHLDPVQRDKIKSLSELQVHKNRRVMAIETDQDTDVLYSIGEDGYFCKTSIKNSKTLSSNKLWV